MNDLAQRIANLSPEKRALLELRLRQQAPVTLPAQTIPRYQAAQPAPLSFAQQRLWFLEQLQPGLTAYHIPTAYRLLGPIHVPALQQSLTEIVRRHESLRTTFSLIDGEPRQIINPPQPCLFPVDDLGHLPADAWDVEIQNRLQAEASRPFDLTKAVMLRARLLRFGDEEHLLSITVHHIAWDGWSGGLFWQELAQLYAAFVQDRPSPLADLPVQYVDYTLWQRQQLQGAVLQTQIDYWQQQLAAVPPLLTLPTDAPRPTVQSFRGQRLALTIPRALTDALHELGRQAEATLFMTLLAAFQTLLHRYSHQDDILIGAPIAGRPHVQLEGMLGFFVNTLVLRANFAEPRSFRALLQQVRATTLAAYEHQALPFDRLVEELAPERKLSYHPIFQVAFALHNTPQTAPHLWGLTVERLELHAESAKFDLDLSLTERSEGLVGHLTYNTDLFEAATIERMVGHFQTLLAAIVADPAQWVGLLPILQPAERQQLLREWNQTQTCYPRQCTIPQLFEAQAEQTPQAIALAGQDQELTYAQVNAAANQLAHYLRNWGVGPEKLVGLCLPRSPQMIIAILAILKAGGAYLPLNPEDPAERLHWMVTDGNLQLILTESQLCSRLPATSEQLFCLDRDWAACVASQPATNLPPLAQPTDLAYVMYTSGSTGRPKGVMVTHRNVVRLVCNSNYLPFDATLVFLQLAPVTFDAATFEIWGALLNGARLAIMPPGTPTLSELATALTTYQVNVLWLTAGLFHLMVAEQVVSLKGLRYLLAGGDVLSVTHVRQALQALPNCTLINGYGPTENTTFSTYYPITQVEQTGHTVPIGRPIANSQVYILDRYRQPVPIGVVGELYVGGDGVARGYFNQPGLTAERFIANPFGADHLYKTGDFVRYLPSGAIEFLGRQDNQVKLHGFRVELDEIETRLNDHPAIQQSVVVVSRRADNDQKLLAYWVAKPAMTATAGELGAWLKQWLPAYMAPNAFVRLDSFPLTPNGKVNRSALAQQVVDTSSIDAYVAPADPLEVALAAIWIQLLQVKAVGATDRFFELGGHSLLAIQLMAELRRVFGVDVPLATLFAEPTIAGLAAYLRQQRAGGKTPLEAVAPRLGLLVPIRQHGTRPPFFLVAGGNGGEVEFLVYAPLIYLLGDEQPVYGLQARGLDGVTPPHRDIASMAADYVQAIRTVQPQGPYFLGGECIGGKIAFAMAAQLQAQGETVAFLALLDTALDPAPAPKTQGQFLARWARQRVTYHLDHLRQLRPRAQLRYLQK